MDDRLTGFQWDEGNRGKCQKHGLTLSEIEGVLSGPVAIRPDAAHSDQETRFLGIGRTPEGRYIFVAFTIRESAGGKAIRPISARYMHRREVELYEYANPQINAASEADERS